MTRVLVTGAAGFIGAHIVDAAVARGLDVIALTHRNPLKRDEVVSLNADLRTADLTALLRLHRPEVVINAASYGVGAGERDPSEMFAVNTVATERLLRAAIAADLPRFIQLGTYSEYGDHPEPITEETVLLPKDDYGATKAAASLLTVAAQFEAIVLRLFNVWGPGERPHRLLQRVIGHCRTNTRLPLTSGDQVKDWCYVGDVADWIIDVALRSSTYPHRVFNVASGDRRSVRDMATAAARALHGEHLLDFGAVPIPSREAQTGPADLTRISALLPTRRITPLGDALAATIAATPS